MPRDLARQISSQQRIKVQLAQIEMNLRREVLAQMHVASNVGSRKLHVRVRLRPAGELQRARAIYDYVLSTLWHEDHRPAHRQEEDR